MRAALSHSRSSVAGQKASRCTRLPWMPLAASVLILERPLGGGGCEDRLGQPKTLPVLLELPELLRSHEGKKAETRCMAAVRKGSEGGLSAVQSKEIVTAPPGGWDGVEGGGGRGKEDGKDSEAGQATIGDIISRPRSSTLPPATDEADDGGGRW
ncbi:hypothetical protein MKX07_008307 [Trichoderma sp. CBMAI-0711]|nr:hypothetical protein MKX07_008307 [Trichoderma sp. CBMAI-0711]